VMIRASGDYGKMTPLHASYSSAWRGENGPSDRQALRCGSAWKKDPVSGVIGAQKGPLISVV